MYLIIERGGEVDVCRRLSPTESLDPRHHAARYAEAIGYPLDLDGPHTPVGLGADVDVTIRPTKAPSVRVWDSAGYYLIPE